MPSSPSLTSTLQEQSGLTADALAAQRRLRGRARAPAAAPSARGHRRVPDATSRPARVRSVATGRVDVSGVRGCAVASVAAAVARTGRRVVLVSPDLDTARRTAEDVGFFLRGALVDTDDADD